MDTSFERVRRTLLRLGETDRVPLFELSVHKEIKAQILGRAIRTAQDDVDFWKFAGYDFVPVRAGVRSIVRGLNPAVRRWLQERPGSASLTNGWVGEHSSFIHNRQDFLDFPWPKPEELGGDDGCTPLDDFIQSMSACLPPEMKLIVQLGYVFMGTWQVMGFENFAYQLADDPELVRSVVDQLASSQLAVLEALLQYGCVGAVWMPDDLAYNSGPMAAPSVLRYYIYPWYRQMVQLCQQANIPVGLHSDGNLKRLLPDLVDCGFDCLHPLEPPMNDIVLIKKEWGDRISLAGNIDLKNTLCAGSPEDVEAEVRLRSTQLAPGGSWLVGSSNSIPEFVPLENYRALLAASLRYGRPPCRGA
jgi:uroporphyrinogen decarboxylase